MEHRLSGDRDHCSLSIQDAPAYAQDENEVVNREKILDNMVLALNSIAQKTFSTELIQQMLGLLDDLRGTSYNSVILIGLAIPLQYITVVEPWMYTISEIGVYS